MACANGPVSLDAQGYNPVTAYPARHMVECLQVPVLGYL
jgi:hypothetical protein